MTQGASKMTEPTHRSTVEPSVVFLSYSRRDLEPLRQLSTDLTQAGFRPWHDQELTGGQKWWDQILDRIRSCDVFVLLLSPDWVDSKACRSELEYAVSLGRPVVPVVVRQLSLDAAPAAIGETQVIDLRERTPENVIAMLNALRSPGEVQPQVDPLPDPPRAPMSELGDVRSSIGQPTLTEAEQRAVVAELFAHTDDASTHQAVAVLAEALSNRPDFVTSLAPALDRVSDRLRHAAAADESQDPEVRADLVRAISSHLERGRFTPIVGHGLTTRFVGTRAELALEWADGFDFPLEPHRRTDLAEVAQFISVMTDEDTLRERIGDFVIQRLGGLDDTDRTDPRTRIDELLRTAWLNDRGDDRVDAHRVLAGLPCSIFINASPWPLLTDALIEEGKEPVVELCRWRTDAWDWPDSIFETEPEYEPSIDRPLVYHVFGALQFPDSYVITEDDYLDFMAAVNEDRTLIPSPVRRALADSALLLLGVDLEEWDVRVLLRCLVGQEGSSRLNRYTHVAAQVDPTDAVASPTRAKLYLERYFGRFRQPAIDIYWGSADDLMDDLRKAGAQTP